MSAVAIVLTGLLSVTAQGGEPGAGQTPPAFEVREVRNVPYRELERGELIPLHNLADIYVPDGVRGFPVVVLVHGGAWAMGDKTLDFIPDVSRTLARQGIGVVAPNYRLSPAVRHPAHVSDVARAVAWTKKQLPAYGGRTEGMFLVGHSAGGHLVSLLAADETWLEAAGLTRDDLLGVVAISGVYQVTDVTLELFPGSSRFHRTIKANPFTAAFGRDPEVGRQASPIMHAQPGLPPFLVLYAEEELPTLREMAENFCAALSREECDVRLHKVPDRNHLTILWNARSAEDPVARSVVQFVREHALLEHGAGS